MRIGIMLRALDERGGIGVYTQNVLRELLALDGHNDYVLFYRSPVHLGRYAGRPHVTERLVRARSKLLWDQVAIPLACRRDRIDVVFHPKFTVPLLAPCRTVMVVHGADWLIPGYARYYPRLNVRLMKFLLPRYVRRCDKVVSVSELTTRDFREALGLPPGKIETVYFGPARHFGPVTDPARLQAVTRTYGLPARFVLTLSGHDRGRRKNIDRILEGYRLYHARSEAPRALVVGGQRCERFRKEFGIPDGGWGSDVHFTGWIDQADLPAVYCRADAYLYPSNLEAFPIPLTEAMTCGTPVITSSRNGLQEIAADAAWYVDPDDPEDIAAGLDRVLRDGALREDLRRRGLRRAQAFGWDACTRRTLEILESVGRGAAA